MRQKKPRRRNVNIKGRATPKTPDPTPEEIEARKLELHGNEPCRGHILAKSTPPMANRLCEDFAGEYSLY